MATKSVDILKNKQSVYCDVDDGKRSTTTTAVTSSTLNIHLCIVYACLVTYGLGSYTSYRVLRQEMTLLEHLLKQDSGDRTIPLTTFLPEIDCASSDDLRLQRGDEEIENNSVREMGQQQQSTEVKPSTTSAVGSETKLRHVDRLAITSSVRRLRRSAANDDDSGTDEVAAGGDGTANSDRTSSEEIDSTALITDDSQINADDHYNTSTSPSSAERRSVRHAQQPERRNRNKVPRSSAKDDEKGKHNIQYLIVALR